MNYTSLPSKCARLTPFFTNCRAHPVLPQDLASDIQQFVQTEFARQYFSTHRTGFIFRRRVPVERLMTWQKVLIFSSIHLLSWLTDDTRFLHSRH